MIETNEKVKEVKIKKNEIFRSESLRNADKKSTISLSEVPNIINEVTQYYGQTKNGNSSIFNLDDEHSFQNQQKLKSFINEPISHNKEESRSSLEEIRVLIKTAINENKNKSIGKKDKKHINHSKKKTSSIEPLTKNKRKRK